MLSVIGYKSPFSEDCTITPYGSASADMGGGNVINDDLSLVWRAASPIGVIRFDFASTRYRNLDAVFLAGHNLDDFSDVGSEGDVVSDDSWELFASDRPDMNVFQLPDSVQEATNLTSAGGFVQLDPFATSQAVPAYTTTAPGSLSRLRVRFASPLPGFVSSLPAFPAYPQQLFLVSFKTSGSGTLTLTARLKESGTLRATLLTSSISAVTDSAIFIPWNGASLVSGVIPELELEVAATGTAAVTWNAIRWDAYLLHNPPHYYHQIQLPLLAATWRPSDFTTLSDVHIMDASQVVARLFVRLNKLSGPPQVGRIDGGSRYRFNISRDSFSIGIEDPSVIVQMRGGNVRIHERRPYLVAEVRTAIEPIDQALEQKLAIEKRVGLRRGLFWMFDDEADDGASAPGDPRTGIRAVDTWFFGRLSELSPFTNNFTFFSHAFKVQQIR